MMKLKLFRKREGAARRPGLGPIKYRLIAFFCGIRARLHHRQR